jgi:DNA-binding HxlR family transcriptional regulator
MSELATRLGNKHSTAQLVTLKRIKHRKQPNRRKDQLTDKGRRLTTLLNALLDASTQKLLDMAA